MTIDFRVDRAIDRPVHEQIADGIRRAIAIGALEPGARLPTVRDLAQQAGVNINTVARAYQALAGERLIETRRGAGSIVSVQAPDRIAGKQRAALAALCDELVSRGLALGVTLDEVEAAINRQLSRWRAVELQGSVVRQLGADTVRFAGSHDLSLELLIRRLAARRPPIRVEARYIGSLEGLIALARDEAEVAGCHLLDAESGEFNLPFVRRLLPGRDVTVVTLAERRQGLLVAAGNPRGIRGVADIAAPGVRLANRQRGSGTRLLLDTLLRRHGIPTAEIDGYQQELSTHHAVAAAVRRGEADVGPGIEAAATAHGLEFIPLADEPYQLVIPNEQRRRPEVETILTACRDRELQRLIASLGGYDVRTTGREQQVA